MTFTKGEKRFEELLLKCLCPAGVSAEHAEAVKRTRDERSGVRHAIHEHTKRLCKTKGIEVLDDINDPVDEGD